jgi:hypothetical protein
MPFWPDFPLPSKTPGTFAAFENSGLRRVAHDPRGAAECRVSFRFVHETLAHIIANEPVSVGTIKYQATNGDSNDLQGVILAVTTRNISNNPQDLGLYKNTPLDAIDFVLNEVIEEAKQQNVRALALPLIGTGYANIGRTANDPAMRALLQQAVILLTLQKLVSALQDASSPIRRGVLVLYPKDPVMQSQADSVWALVPTFLARDNEMREMMIQDIHDHFTKSMEAAQSQTDENRSDTRGGSRSSGDTSLSGQPRRIDPTHQAMRPPL